MKRVLFDSDVLLDVLAQRQPFIFASAQALNRTTSPDVEGYVSGHAIANLFYILRRQIGAEMARVLLLRLSEQLYIAGVTDEVIRAALRSPLKDFEDTVTSEAAKYAGTELIITRNVADYVGSLVPAISPDEFLRSS